MFDNGPKQRRRNGQVMRRMLSSAQLFAKRVEGCTVGVVAIDIAQQATQLLESRGINPAVFLKAVLSPGAELVEVPTGFRNPNDGDVKMSPFDHRLQRGEDFLVREIAGCTKKHQCV